VGGGSALLAEALLFFLRGRVVVCGALSVSAQQVTWRRHTDGPSNPVALLVSYTVLTHASTYFGGFGVAWILLLTRIMNFFSASVRITTR